MNADLSVNSEILLIEHFTLAGYDLDDRQVFVQHPERFLYQSGISRLRGFLYALAYPAYLLETVTAARALHTVPEPLRFFQVRVRYALPYDYDFPVPAFEKEWYEVHKIGVNVNNFFRVSFFRHIQVRLPVRFSDNNTPCGVSG